MNRMNHHYPYRAVIVIRQQNTMRAAVQATVIHKPAKCRKLRDSFTIQLLERRNAICMNQGLLGHDDLKTNLIYTHVLDHEIVDVKSPANFFFS